MKHFDLSGTTSLVTGTSSGLGRHFAAVLSEAGSRVILAGRQLDKMQELAAELAQAGRAVEVAAMDVTSSGSITTAIDRMWALAGPITIVVNNAGVAATALMLDQAEKAWRTIVDTNLLGAAQVSQVVARKLIEQGTKGSIINIASILGLYGAAGLSAYAASKAALLSLTRSMALELGPHGIRVNAIAPGYVRTDLSKDFFETNTEALRARIPLRRFIEPADLDGVLLLLASEASSAVTGATFVVDAGHSLAWGAE